MLEQSYFLRSAVAFIRGRALQGYDIAMPPHLLNSPLDSLSSSEWESIFNLGIGSGLRLHKFKRTMGLARVRKIFGILQSLAPENLLDIGSGRGAFLWPLLEEFPTLSITVAEIAHGRARDLDAARLGGLSQLQVFQMDATSLQFPNSTFDVVTILEVLEHIPNPQLAVNELARVATRSILASVPSQADDNPEHIHLFNQVKLTRLFRSAGIQRLNFDFILNHILLVANLPQRD
jgi:SAM-dependent methyltransferase